MPETCRARKPIPDHVRQSHHCSEPKGHEPQWHRCYCGHAWRPEEEPKRTNLLASAVAVGAVLLSLLSPVSPAAAAPEDCQTVERLPGECLTLATYTYVIDLQLFRDHLIGQLLQERASRQEAQLEVNGLREDLWNATAVLARRNQTISILRVKIETRRQEIRRLHRVIARLR